MISEEAVDAAAEELHDREGYMTSFADGPDYRREHYRGQARSALEAAGPHIGSSLMDELRRSGQHEAADLVGQLAGAP